uniref:Uncharacterized protein n=1 Tax=Phaeodactylum tricornutum TaxID=2850 RepID=A0A8J9TJ29_PHATR
MNENINNPYLVTHPALPPMASDAAEAFLPVQAPTIDAGAPKNPEHLAAAHKQLLQRSLFSIMVPQSVTAVECAAAVSRFHKVSGEHDGALVPAWAQLFMQNMQEFQENMVEFQENTTAQLTRIQQHIAKSTNSSVIYPEDRLASVPNLNGDAPPVFFPETLEAFQELSEQECDTLLAFYGQKAQGTVKERRHALAAILGLRRRAY